MIRSSSYVSIVAALLMGTGALGAQDLTQYREFTLGSPLAAVVAATGVAPSDIRAIHQRPALIQEVRWRPQRYAASVDGLGLDPVREVIFSFFDDQLYMIAVDYDRQRTEGLTDADLVESLSRQYGQPLLSSTDRPAVVSPGPVLDFVVARWGDESSLLTLSRAQYPTSVRLVIVQPATAALARAAAVEAARRDIEEGPQREAETAAKAVVDGQAASAKARATNKPRFKP